MSSPDEIIIFQIGALPISATIFFTWVIIFVLTAGSFLITRNLKSEGKISRWQNMLEVLVSAMKSQVREISGGQDPRPYLPFVGTLFIFIAFSNLLSVIPGFISPTGSLSTTTALAILVFFAVPLYGITAQGLKGYLKQYLQPTFFMLPFNIIGELSRTLALAVRLFGNVMSGTMIVGILITLLPFFFPVIMELFGLLTGMIQAYIFAILALVYIASAGEVHRETIEKKGEL